MLGGKPVVDSLDAIHIGATIQTAFEIDLQSELTAIRDYNAGIKKVTEAGDATTRKMLEEIVDEEETDHADELTSFLDQIKQMGLGPFLVQQVK